MKRMVKMQTTDRQKVIKQLKIEKVEEANYSLRKQVQ